MVDDVRRSRWHILNVAVDPWFFRLGFIITFALASILISPHDLFSGMDLALRCH
jgi:hypothetical protein